jgi:hypothetical protein
VGFFWFFFVGLLLPTLTVLNKSGSRAGTEAGAGTAIRHYGFVFYCQEPEREEPWLPALGMISPGRESRAGARRKPGRLCPSSA